MQDREKLFLLSCCQSGVHHACVREKYPNVHLLTCPKCLVRAKVNAHVIQRDEFSPSDSDKIDLCFVKHHTVSQVPMTMGEIQGLRVALNVRGYRAMRYLSRRAFVVGLAFWIPLPKEKLCDWEDIVSQSARSVLALRACSTENGSPIAWPWPTAPICTIASGKPCTSSL